MGGRNGILDELGRTPLSPQEVLDLESVLSTEAGRRVYYRLIHDLGKVEVVLFLGAMKEGMALAMHLAFRDGYKLIANLMAEEVRKYLPDRWDQLIIEKLRYDRERRDRERLNENQEADNDS